MADGSDAAIRTVLDIAPMGPDGRFAFPSFPAVSLGDATSVTALRQSVRTLATPSDMDVSLTGGATKPVSTITALPQTVDAVMIAHTSELVPNAIYKLPPFGLFIREEMSFGVARGIDKYLLDQLAAASGTTTYTQTAEVTFDAFRSALSVARTAGYNPNLAILHPTDSANLDKTKDANDHYFGSGPQGQAGFPKLWGMDVVESISATAGSPILVDLNRFGTLYFGSAEFATNPFEAFNSNQSRARFEVPMAVFIRQAAAIVEVTLV